jgi:pimeloyl-ACP methyl ester carboxylesterase
MIQNVTSQHDPTWQHGYLKTNGIRLHYVTAGTGPLVLLLHGFPECWYSWRYQIPALAEHYQVVAVDLRGYNESDRPAQLADYRMECLIADVVGVVQGLGHERCTLVGHDWGGAIAWAVADAHPALVDNLIVLNLPHPARMAAGLRTPQQLLRSWYIFLFQLPWLPEWVLQWGDYRVLEWILAGTAANKAAFAPADLNVFKNAAAQQGALSAALNYYRNLFTSGLLNREWRVLEMPTLMIWGEEDTALGKELTYGTEQYVRDFRIHYIPHCGHWVQQERPDLVNRYICEFLAD